MTPLTTSTAYIPTSNSTWRLESDGHLLFPDTDIYRKLDGSLGHTV